MSISHLNISAQQFSNLTQVDDDFAIIDVLTPSEVNTEYLEGCCNLPLQELSPSIVKALLVKIDCDDNKPIYLLCGSGLRAQKASALLAAEIINPLVVIEGGINALKQTGVKFQQGSGSVISLERQVRIAAGLIVILCTTLGMLFSPLFYGLSALVGAGLVFAGVTDTCGMGMALARMPWNQVAPR